MQIKYLGTDKFEIKSKDLEIILSEKVSINGFEFPGAGEYEKAGVIMSGIDDKENTIYVLTVEDINLCHLGRLGHPLSEEEAKQIGNVDILFLPAGAENTIDLKTAAKVITAIDPKVVVPMLVANMDEFKKSEGITDHELDVLKIRKADLPEDERQFYILKNS